MTSPLKSGEGIIWALEKTDELDAQYALFGKLFMEIMAVTAIMKVKKTTQLSPHECPSCLE